MTTGTQYTLRDNRDDKEYFIAKQVDDKIWMTQNLDLCIGCEGTAALTSENTNLEVSGSGAYVEGYTESNGVITWIPDEAATTGAISDYSNGLSDYYDEYKLPRSAEGGEIIVYTSNNDDDDIIFESLSACAAVGHMEDDCKHYHVGNYYNWTAAIASNDSSALVTDGEIATNSICPAGWRLPGFFMHTSDANEMGLLFIKSGIIASYNDSYPRYLENGFNKLRESPLYFTETGSVSRYDGLDYLGSEAYYHSSAVIHSLAAKGIHFNAAWGVQIHSGNRGEGVSVHCVVDIPTATITLDANDGMFSAYNKQTMTFEINIGSSIIGFSNATRAGYSLDGWFTEADGGEEVTIGAIPTEDGISLNNLLGIRYKVPFTVM